MLTLEQIKSYYPPHLQSFKNNLLREYFQYKILEILFDSPIASKISFMGGTCIRIVHEGQRFSEDLDFDNFKLTEKEFHHTAQCLKTALEREGYPIEIKTLIRGKTFHYHIKIGLVLYEYNLSPLTWQKILVKVDTEPQGYSYSPQKILLNRKEKCAHILRAVTI